MDRTARMVAAWLLVSSVAVACGGGPRPAPAAGGRATAPVPPEPAREVVLTLTSVAVGYSDCTVGGTGEAGEDLSFYADDDLCPGGARDASGLVDRKARVTVVKRTITPPCDAEDCGGLAPEEVDWVQAIVPVE